MLKLVMQAWLSETFEANDSRLENPKPYSLLRNIFWHSSINRCLRFRSVADLHQVIGQGAPYGLALP